MEMWLKLLTLKLLAATVMATATPRHYEAILKEKQNLSLDISSGSSLTLRCCLNTSTRARLYWFFNDSGPSFDRRKSLQENLMNKSENTSRDNCKDPEKTYTLSQVNKTHSGWYTCAVSIEIPNLAELQSGGIKVHVLTHPVNPLHVNLWMWILMGVGALVFIVLLIICVLRRRRHRSRDEPIYTNTRRKQPSPRPGNPGVNNLKTVPSSQNLRAPSSAERYDHGQRRARKNMGLINQ
ncbi:uncharacterized protein KZ484_007632 isoform 2-T2 [Pholidichthys leucotaenia]